MTATPCLQFLRPYAWKPLAAPRAAYLRFYHLARQQELQQADALHYPRIQHHVPPMTIPAFREKYQNVQPDSPAGQEVVLYGRVGHVRRASSKLMFLDLTGEFEHVQGLCNFRKVQADGVTLEQFKELSKRLSRGDIVSLTGTATRTKTGELSIDVTRLPELLSPSLVPLPDRLTDDDTRVQNRHVDLLVNRNAADVLRMRSYITKYLRDFLHARGFLEFQTPILAENAGGAVARPFVTFSTEFPSKELSLRIAPELWLKRLVVGGVEKVFEIGPAFRNEGIDQSHNPEFTICEFYNAYANLGDLIKQTEELIVGAAESSQALISTKLTSLPAIDLSKYARPFKQLEFIPELEARLGFQLPDLAGEDALAKLRSLLEQHGIDAGAQPDAPLPKLLDCLAAKFLEPYSHDAPVFITHHPVCMSPLSKSFRCDRTGQLVSARTELFIDGRELANMYEEENDPVAQRHKFVEQVKRHNDPSAESEGLVVDEGYIQALESGLPPTGGWGCGVDRLVMLFSGTCRISDCVSFGNLRNVVGLSSRARTPLDDVEDGDTARGSELANTGDS
ncbi:class II aaRS and biotin synthetase [Thozetella sp. PMI_491]|nr:class II aaRS and biotin synthetase [Thozetella sp. PMI_491]